MEVEAIVGDGTLIGTAIALVLQPAMKTIPMISARMRDDVFRSMIYLPSVSAYFACIQHSSFNSSRTGRQLHSDLATIINELKPGFMFHSPKSSIAPGDMDAFSSTENSHGPILNMPSPMITHNSS